MLKAAKQTKWILQAGVRCICMYWNIFQGPMQYNMELILSATTTYNSLTVKIYFAWCWVCLGFEWETLLSLDVSTMSAFSETTSVWNCSVDPSKTIYTWPILKSMVMGHNLTSFDSWISLYQKWALVSSSGWRSLILGDLLNTSKRHVFVCLSTFLIWI